MSRFQVPVSLLQETAEKIKTFTDENEGMFGEILQLLRSVEGCADWRGNSMQALIKATESNQKKYAELFTELSALGEFLSQYAQSISEKDEELLQSIRSIASQEF